MIIAIDGPAGSGKSSTAKEVAKRTGALYIDTGAMYRAVALSSINSGISVPDAEFSAHLDSLSIKLGYNDGELTVWLNGEDVSSQIRSSEVSDLSSVVGSDSRVRDKMVELQRKMAGDELARNGTVVMEGRDIGSVVFPFADFKFFLVADPAVRTERRALQLEEKGVDVDRDALLSEILARDERDETRSNSPLIQAEDALAMDTSELSFEEQVENILEVIRGNG